MGLLSVQGHPLDYQSSLKHISYIKKHGILQFISIYNIFKSRTNDIFLWGDEIEGFLVSFPTDNKTVYLSLIGSTVLESLHRYTETLSEHEKKGNFLPEYGRHMLEATPMIPYGSYTADLGRVEENMTYRREIINKFLTDNESYITCTVFPLMGVGQFTSRPYPIFGSISQSQYVPDEIINEHPRFAALTKNIRERRGKKVEVKIPLYMDKNTKLEQPPKSTGKLSYPEDIEISESIDDANLEQVIYGDCMSFGMSSSCLQVTFQARSITEARKLYDKLAVLSPIFLALTAASPIFRGKLAATDVRWSAISQSVDDRTDEEKKTIFKSRYSSIDCYISEDEQCLERYNDIPIPIHEESYQTLIEAGIDHRLARHIAHLFIRDPLVIFEERIELDDTKNNDHFENIQSTNWNSVRFKPPPLQGPIGWRVEFRTMEIQLTDFENAAFAVFVAIVSRAILFFNVNLYIPVSQMDINMDRAHEMDAVKTQKFFFRKTWKNCAVAAQNPDEIFELTIEEIFLGKNFVFPGLIPLVQSYLDLISCDNETRVIVENYIKLIHSRATGKLMTCAAWTRDFVLGHPEYKFDSVVTPSIARDLMEAYDDISNNEVVGNSAALLGELNTDNPVAERLLNKKIEKRKKYTEVLESKKLRSISFLDNARPGSCEHITRLFQFHMDSNERAKDNYTLNRFGADIEESEKNASLEYLKGNNSVLSPTSSSSLRN